MNRPDHPVLAAMHDAAGFRDERAQITADYNTDVARVRRETAKGPDADRARALSSLAWNRENRLDGLRRREAQWWEETAEERARLVAQRAEELLQEVLMCLHGTEDAQPVRGLLSVSEELRSLGCEVTPEDLVRRVLHTGSVLTEAPGAALLGTARPARALQLQDGRPASAMHSTSGQAQAPVATLMLQREVGIRSVQAEDVTFQDLDGPDVA